MIAKSINEFSFDKDWDFERNVKERDVMDLPNYFARDDGLELWYAVKTYVQDVIDIFYLNDEDVRVDDELQRWFKEISRYVLHLNLGFSTFNNLCTILINNHLFK